MGGGRSTIGRLVSFSRHILYMNFDDNEEGIENTLYLGIVELDIIRFHSSHKVQGYSAILRA